MLPYDNLFNKMFERTFNGGGGGGERERKETEEESQRQVPTTA